MKKEKTICGHCDKEIEAGETSYRFCAQCLGQIRQETIEETEEKYRKELSKWMDAVKTIKKETLEEVLKMLPEEKELIVDSVNFPTGKITTADMKIGFNSCLKEIKEKLLNLKGE